MQPTPRFQGIQQTEQRTQPTGLNFPIRAAPLQKNLLRVYTISQVAFGYIFSGLHQGQCITITTQEVFWMVM